MKLGIFLTGFLVAGTCLATEVPADFLSALSTIVDRHPDVKVQQENLSALKAQNLPTHLNLLPSLSLSASHDRSLAFGTNTSRTGLGASVDLNLFRFGADLKAQKAASTEEKAQDLAVHATILKVEAEATGVLLNVIQAQKEVLILRRMVENRDQALSIAQARFKRGLLAAQEVDKVAVDRDNALAELRDAEAALAITVAELRALLGHNSAFDGEWPWPSELARVSSRLLQTSVEELLARPDWGMARERKMAAQFRAEQGFARIFPSLDLSLSYGFSQYTSIPDPGSYQGPEWRAGVILTVPLFDRLANYSTYRSLRHAQNAAEWEIERVRRQAQVEWESAKENLKVALNTLELRQQTLKFSRKLFSDNRKRFESGLASANELSVDLQRLLNSERLVIRGQTQAHLSMIRLCHSLGHTLSRCVSAE